MNMKAVEGILIDYSIAVEDRDICDKKIESEIRSLKRIARDIVETESNSYSAYHSDVFNIASIASDLGMYAKIRAEHDSKASTIIRIVRCLGDDKLLAALAKIDNGEYIGKVFDEYNQND